MSSSFLENKIKNYESNISTYLSQIDEINKQESISIDIYLVRMLSFLSSGFLRPVVKELLLNCPPCELFSYIGSYDYKILNSNISNNDLSSLVSIIRGSGHNLLYILEQYQRLVKDTRNYISELKDKRIKDIMMLIEYEKKIYQLALDESVLQRE